jgi:di/tricarboxylate transporter
MSLAVLSVGALVLAVAVSCFSSLNVGVLAVALAWLVGVYAGGMSVNQVMAGFPSQLFLTVTGVTLLFSLAQSNGSLDKLTHEAMRGCRGHRGVLPIMFFVLAAALASLGPGNIATAALIAPTAMAAAGRAGIPLFLMAIMVGNGANSGSLSPFAPTGIIVTGLMNRIGMPGHEVQTYLSNLLAHAGVAFGGYFLLGGLKLFGAGARAAALEPAVAASVPAAVAATHRSNVQDPQRPQSLLNPSNPSNPLDPLNLSNPLNPSSFEPRHLLTLGVIAALILSSLFLDVNVGLGAFLGSVLLVLTGAADDKEAIKRMPWSVIVMVCGMTVLIGVLEKAEGIDLLVGLVAKFSSRETVTAVIALITGLISVYSSTSGVVLPAFLPMVPGLAHQLGGANAMAIATSINVGGHLVDVSPLSTIGALCIASAPTDDIRPLFNKLLAWGLSMAFVGAAVCWTFFR